MDIEEIKKYVKNKIEADDLTKQVRRQIKETTWEKQNQREGFTETFKPLISQFEKPEDPKTKNIFTQNQEMLRNQLALTEGLRDNQRAITQGFSQLERLGDMRELLGVEAIEDEEDKAQSAIAKEDKEDKAQSAIAKEDKEPKNILKLEKIFNENDLFTLTEYDYPRPNDFFDTSKENLENYLKDVNKEIKSLTGQINGRKRNKNPTEEYVALTLLTEEQKETLMKYKNTIKDYLKSLEYKVGQGLYFSPQELLKRFELLNGSLAAGNNGVLPEYIQITHRLRDLGIITNNQLNALLRKII